MQTPDVQTLAFTPYGLGITHTLTPEAALEYQQDVLASTDLADAVAHGTKASFDRARKAFEYGVLDYEFFTMAGDLARLTIEQALRDRFLEYYEWNIPFVNKRGEKRWHPVRTFDDVRDALDKLRKKKNAEWQLWLPRTRGTIEFNGMLAGLFSWARREGLLPGQWARRLQKPQVDLRNTVAHPSGYNLGTPVDAARAIRDIAEIINCLWGVRTPGGRLHPAPVRREVLAIMWDDNRITIGPVGVLRDVEDAQVVTCMLVRAVPDDVDLMQFDAMFETTRYPSELLWGPGTPHDALEWHEQSDISGDEVDHLDRLLLIRLHDGQLEPPRRPDVAAGFAAQQPDGVWYLVRADDPQTAYGHLRDVLAGDQAHASSGPCSRCAADSVCSGSWHEVSAMCQQLGVSIAETPMPDVRVPSPLPRWGESGQ
ncbi:hypothetical protein [Lentzea sp. HUAS12]|uniref:hypothetical protein n=1 Tax=Lentzea sp. HUAS12 TaxID=2951806 RepID=UPI00209F7039|nr:hypothetical protein [Lentzea sp. HUAS12]USX56232.1 hypothetical protein ND450_19660 [Lentzea sp. HUAS12]